MEWSYLGKLMIVLGGVLLLLGVFLALVGERFRPHVPGDVSFAYGNVRFWFPLGTCILLSILLSVILNLVIRR